MPLARRRLQWCFQVLALLSMIVASVGSLPAAAQRTPELVMFEEAGCPWCRRFDQEIAPAYPKTPEGRLAPLRRLDIGSAKSSGIRLARPVTVTPTFVLVVDNAEIGRLTGYPGADFFWSLLGEVLAKLPQDDERRGAAGDDRRHVDHDTWQRLGDGRRLALFCQPCSADTN